MADNKLSLLHDLLTDEMIRQLRASGTDEPLPAAVMSAIAKFLKDNHFEASDDEPGAADLRRLVEDYQKSLPEGEPL